MRREAVSFLSVQSFQKRRPPRGSSPPNLKAANPLPQSKIRRSHMIQIDKLFYFNPASLSLGMKGEWTRVSMLHKRKITCEIA